MPCESSLHDLLPPLPALPEPVRPVAVQGKRAAPIQEPMVQGGGGVLRLGEQEEVVALEDVFGHAGEDERVPTARRREALDLRRPGTDGAGRNDAALVAAGNRHAVHAANQVRGLRWLLEHRGPDGLERRLGSDHRQEPECPVLGVASEGVRRGGETARVDCVQGFGVNHFRLGSHWRVLSCRD